MEQILTFYRFKSNTRTHWTLVAKYRPCNLNKKVFVCPLIRRRHCWQRPMACSVFNSNQNLVSNAASNLLSRVQMRRIFFSEGIKRSALLRLCPPSQRLISLLLGLYILTQVTISLPFAIILHKLKPSFSFCKNNKSMYMLSHQNYSQTL